MSEARTIAAISTPQAAGGIGVIRISGEQALQVAARVFRPTGGADLTASAGYRAYHGRVFDESGDIDEAVCLVFRAPKSYTGEDVAELSCHGGLFILKKVLAAVLQNGAAAAQAGEFTRRAFLHGKMDLTEAEAVMDLIAAQGEQAAQAALHALDGALSKEIRGCAQTLIGTAAQLAAWVDYPDEEIEALDTAQLLAVLEDVRARLNGLLARFDMGAAVTQGVDTVIVGRPNVGKSTLMNLLTGQERSIVTSVAGTTRDIVEETVVIDGVTLRLADTAGLHETGDPVEKIGVARARTRLDRAQLVLAVIDGAESLTAEDIELLEACRGKQTVVILNKTDLPQQTTAADLAKYAELVVPLSAANGSGAAALGQAIATLLGTDAFDPSAAMLVNERQRDCCRRAAELLGEAAAALSDGMTLDAVNVDLDVCIETLLELTGERATQRVVDEVFARFCVGK